LSPFHLVPSVFPSFTRQREKMDTPGRWLDVVPELAGLDALVKRYSKAGLYPEVMRVNQLDAGVLDNELHDLLRTQLNRVFSMFQASSVERYKPEVEALLRLLLWRFTVWSRLPTPGMKLQSLRYGDGRAPQAPFLDGALSHGGNDGSTSSGGGVGTSGGGGNGGGFGGGATATQRLAFGMLYIGAPWALTRLTRWALACGWDERPDGDWRHAVWRALRRAEAAYRALWLLNLLLFLRTGAYPTPLER
ncbi:unnamed protein product, partial [Phaeothamnion confervicola]